MRRLLAGITIGFLCQGCDQMSGSSDQRLKTLEARVDALEKRLAASGQVGRYQVVNPNPGFRVDTKLLDTVTGHTWLACRLTVGGKAIEGPEGAGWCEMGQAEGRGRP